MAGDGYYGVHERPVGWLGRRGGEAIYASFACALALTVSGLAAYALKQTQLSPSLGPTALLLFERPMFPGASPRNALIGHPVAVLAGALCLYVFGLHDDLSVLAEGVTLARVGAAGLSLAFVGAVLLLLRASRPPAGATVLIVSLGLLKTPTELGMVMAGVATLFVAGWLSNRALVTPFPVRFPKSKG